MLVPTAGEMKDVLVSVTYLTREGEIVTEDAANLSLSYRHSIFEENGGCILSAKFHLEAWRFGSHQGPDG